MVDLSFIGVCLPLVIFDSVMTDASFQQIELRHLQTFLAVVEEMSFSRAAERLGIAQPPLSRQIQRLEATLDVKLFERTRPQITLTSAGEIFVKGARSVLQQVEQSVQLTQLASQGRAGHLTVGLDSSAPAVIRFFKRFKRTGRNTLILTSRYRKWTQHLN